ncbi:hypothetical protein [Acidiphilium acidophilum]|uniref:hypothetical protein n=1 Tax=Acidiphilium acidophilum TaxID=76588 RepID=UPI002E8E625F|nr:hypothetical protein [Acidiphilium acidophilum]
MNAPQTAIEALLADLRDRAWRGDAEAQTNYVNIGMRRADSAMEVSREIDRLIAANRWNPTPQGKP